MCYEIPVQYIATLALCIVELLCYSGIVYGWGALVFVLKQEGYFAEKCATNETVVEAVNLTWNKYGEESVHNDSCVLDQDGCYEQNASLNLVFTVGACFVECSGLFWGPMYDRLGTRFTRITLCVLELIGCLFIAFSTKETSILLFPGIVCLASGGIAILIVNMQTSNLFGHRKSTMITIMSGCLDSSAFMMLFVKIGYEGGISIRTAFLILAGGTLLFNVNTFVLMPSKHIPWPLPPNYRVRGKRQQIKSAKQNDVMENGETRTASAHNETGNIAQEEKETVVSSIEVAEAARRKDFPTLRSCILSPLFLLALLFLAVLQLRMLYFLGTFNPWLEMLSGCHQETVSHYTTVLVLCQAMGLFLSPLCGLLLDRNKSKSDNDLRGPYADLQDSALVFALATALFMLFSVTILIPILEMQYVTFILHVITRAFLYSLIGSGTSIFFPMQYFGTVYGIMIGLGGIFGLLQYPLFLLGSNLLKNDPFYVNIGLLVLCAVTFALPIYICRHVKKKKKYDQISQRDVN